MKVSIITVSYNSATTILETIESVNNQSYLDVEHILVDGGSTDSTLEVFQQRALREPSFISEKDDGIYDAMNKGLLLAKGEVVGFLNGDDSFVNSDIIERIVSQFRIGADFVHGNIVFINKDGRVKRVWNSMGFQPKDLLKSMSPAHPTLYCKRSIMLKLGGFDTSFRIAGDIEFMVRGLLLGHYKLHHINETFISMRLGGVSTSSFKSHVRITCEVWRAFKKNGVAYSKVEYILGKLTKALKQIRI